MNQAYYQFILYNNLNINQTKYPYNAFKI